MDDAARGALATDRVVDITTTGRRSGEARRIETWYHRAGGRYYLTGIPGRRGWYANLEANPDFTFHLKESARADLPATAVPVTEAPERRQVLDAILTALGRQGELEAWVADSPLVEVVFAD
jgi:deazaflavin-dependent oxidoreductase (nitroreductase family)